MTADSGDAALVAAACRGDKTAFAELVDRHYPLLLRMCRRAVVDPEVAADAAQEAVLDAMLGLDRLRRPDLFGPWLAGIGLNVCRRMVQRRIRAGWSLDAMLDAGWTADPVDPHAGPDELTGPRSSSRSCGRRCAHCHPANGLRPPSTTSTA